MTLKTISCNVVLAILYFAYENQQTIFYIFPYDVKTAKLVIPVPTTNHTQSRKSPFLKSLVVS